MIDTIKKDKMQINFIEDTKNKKTKNNIKVKSADSKLKEMLVEYVGATSKTIKNNEVTVDEIVETFASEFPEFLLVVAEENWIRGYHQGLVDVEVGEKLANEKNNSSTNG